MLQASNSARLKVAKLGWREASQRGLRETIQLGSKETGVGTHNGRDYDGGTHSPHCS